MSTGPVLSSDVRAALAGRAPVVALESALITHGFAHPANAAISRAMAEAVRDTGATPAVVGIWGGVPRIGLDEAQIDVLASGGSAEKVSIRDLPLMRLRGANGGTTVAATAHLAHLAGIEVFATGGIGGVHRGHPEDVSADLPILASTPLVVVCAGAKSILDLPRTREVLETSGVPVVGWCTDEFPAFYSRSSGLPVDIQVQTAQDVAEIVAQQRSLSLRQAVLVVVPVPAEDEVPVKIVEPLIAQAVAEAEQKGITGKAVTPFVLARLVALTGKDTQRANERLLIQNARVAAEIAVALCRQ
jgi:pseudouridine-5'-phosphate glycosidase